MKTILASFALATMISSPVFAANCGPLNKLVSERKVMIDKIMSWKQVHTDVITACWTLTELEKNTSETLQLLAMNGAECKAPTTFRDTLNKDLPAINKAKLNACNRSTGHYQNELVRP